MVGILSYGGYVPYYRLPRSVIGAAWGRAADRGEKAVCNFDEDSVTMAVAAGMDCLTGFDPKQVDGLFLASTTAPYKEGQSSAIVAAALGLRRDIRTADFANGLRAGTSALMAAVDAVKAGTARNILVAAADSRLGAPQGEHEQALGDGAAAFLVGQSGVIATIDASYVISEPFPDFWRASDDLFVRSWEDRFGLDEGYREFLKEVVAAVLEQAGLTIRDIARVLFYAGNERRQREMVRVLGLEAPQVQDQLLSSVGNTGSALAPMMLAAALEEAAPGDRLLLVNYGSGSDACVLTVTEQIKSVGERRAIKGHLQAKRTLDSYTRYLRWRDIVPVERAARPEISPVSQAALWRDRKAILALYGGRCTVCGTPQLFMNMTAAEPRVCVNCQAKDQFEDYRFADKRATIFTYTQDRLAASVDPPHTVTVVDFEGGGRAPFEMTDRDPEEVKVGMPVEMTFRKLYLDRGIHNYYWKTRPPR